MNNFPERAAALLGERQRKRGGGREREVCIMNSILNEMVSTTKTSQISGCGRLQKAKVNCSHIFRIHMPVPVSRAGAHPQHGYTTIKVGGVKLLGGSV